MNIDMSNYEMEHHFNKLSALVQSDKALPASAAYGIVRALNTMRMRYPRLLWCVTNWFVGIPGAARH